MATRQCAQLSYEVVQEFQGSVLMHGPGSDARLLELLGPVRLIENAGPRVRTLSRSLCANLSQRIGLERRIAEHRIALDRAHAALAKEDARLVIVNQDIDAIRALLAP